MSNVESKPVPKRKVTFEEFLDWCDEDSLASIPLCILHPRFTGSALDLNPESLFHSLPDHRGDVILLPHFAS
jgi:Uma2 family endonuclease